MSTMQPYVPGQRKRPAYVPAQKLSRLSQLRIWWREVDRVLLALILMLMAFGAVAVAAGSPASAARLSTTAETLDPLYFFYRHLAWQALGIATMLGVSMLDRENARRLGILLAVSMTFFLFLVPIIGTEVNGARRWLDLGIRFQPSEFLKPGFAIFTAWVLSWRVRDPNLPVVALSGIALGIPVILIMMQPNLGGTILLVATWSLWMLTVGVMELHGFDNAGKVFLGVILSSLAIGFALVMLLGIVAALGIIELPEPA